MHHGRRETVSSPLADELASDEMADGLLRQWPTSWHSTRWSTSWHPMSSPASPMADVLAMQRLLRSPFFFGAGFPWRLSAFVRPGSVADGRRFVGAVRLGSVANGRRCVRQVELASRWLVPNQQDLHFIVKCRSLWFGTNFFGSEPKRFTFHREM